MAARRLLIVMLILLGLSTLAAALVPQHALRGGTTGSTTTRTTQTATTAAPAGGRSLRAKIFVGGKQVPVVAGPVCKKRKPRCEPIHVGDQLSLSVLSRKQAELEIPEFGLVGVASRNTPAFFQLLLDQPENVGVLFTSPHGVAARIEVLSEKAAAKAVATAKPKSRAPSGSGPA
jgi:hypothetical protein